MCHSSRKTSQSHTSTNQPKIVQAQEDQNTGKNKNVNIVEMIRSMGLRERQAKKSVNVQEMTIVHELIDTKPVFYTPVQPQIVTTIWEQIDNQSWNQDFV